MEQIPKRKEQSGSSSIFSGSNEETNTMNFYDEEYYNGGYSYENYAIERMRGRDEPIFTQSKEPVCVLSDGTELYPIPSITEFFNPENEHHVDEFIRITDSIIKKNAPIVRRIFDFDKEKSRSLINSPATTMLSEEDLKENPFFNGDYIEEIRYLEEMYNMLRSCQLQIGDRRGFFIEEFSAQDDGYLSGQIFFLAQLVFDIGLYSYDSDDFEKIIMNLDQNDGWVSNCKDLNVRKRYVDEVLGKVESHELRAKMKVLYYIPLELTDKVSLPVLKILFDELGKGNKLVCKLLESELLNGTRFSNFLETKGMGGFVRLMLTQGDIMYFFEKSSPEDICKLFNSIGVSQTVFEMFILCPELFTIFATSRHFIEIFEEACMMNSFKFLEEKPLNEQKDAFISFLVDSY